MEADLPSAFFFALDSKPSVRFNLLWRVTSATVGPTARRCYGKRDDLFYGSWVNAQMGRVRFIARDRLTLRNLRRRYAWFSLVGFGAVGMNRSPLRSMRQMLRNNMRATTRRPILLPRRLLVRS